MGRALAGVLGPGVGILTHVVDELGHGQVFLFGAVLVSELHEVVGRSPGLGIGGIVADGGDHLEVDAGIHNSGLHPDAFGPDQHVAGIELGGIVCVLHGGVAAFPQILHGLEHFLHVLVVDAGIDAVFGQGQVGIQLAVVAQQLSTHPAQVGDIAFKTGGLGLVAQFLDFVKGQIAVFHIAVQVILIEQVSVVVGDIGVHVQRDAVVLAVDVGAGPCGGVVVFLLDTGLSDQVHVIGIQHFLVHEVGDALDVHDADIRDAGAGLHSQGDLLIQVVSGHGGVVHVHFILGSVEGVHHALHGSAVSTGEHGPVVDFDGSSLSGGCQSQNHHQGQDDRDSFFHGITSLYFYRPTWDGGKQDQRV